MFKLKELLHRGIVFVHEDGKTFEMAPVQLFAGPTGETVLRIGRNILVFTAEGEFDGSYSKHDPVSSAKTITRALVEQEENLHQPPPEPFFAAPTDGHTAETSRW